MFKDVIKMALGRQENLSFNDLKYILLNRKSYELKRILKTREDQYKIINRVFQDENNKWISPFHSYDYSSSYLAQVLKEMIKNGEIKKDPETGKYKLNRLYEMDAIRSEDKVTLDSYNLNHIYVYTPFHHRKKHECPTRVYGINEEFLQHAEQVGLKEEILSKINDIENLSSVLNQLKWDAEGMYKTKLFLDQCKKLRDPQIIKVVLNNLHYISWLIRIPSLYEKVNITKNERVRWSFDKVKAKFEIENELARTKRKKRKKEKELTSEQIDKIVKILERVYKINWEFYNIPDREFLISVVVNRCPTGDIYDSKVDSYIKELKKTK